MQGGCFPASKARTRIFFYIQSEDILTKRGQNFSPRFVNRCTVLTLSIYGYRVGYGRYPLFVRAIMLRDV